MVSLSLLDSSVVVSTAAAEVGAAFASGILAAILVLLATPAIEVLFGYTTAMKLTDLADMNHPLLRELLIEAPGTYHHSIMVGKLAHAGAKAIGADPLLALVGAYFHDVGKIKNPRAFDENSPPDASPFSSTDASSAIRAHVADGLEFAAKHRVGQQVLEMIAQHHGTSPIRVYMPTGLDLSGAALRTAELTTPLRYPGPKPLTPVAALVLMADTTEVAARGLASSTASMPGDRALGKGDRDLLADGQLDDSMLSGMWRSVKRSSWCWRILRRNRPTQPQLSGATCRARGGYCARELMALQRRRTKRPRRRSSLCVGLSRRRFGGCASGRRFPLLGTADPRAERAFRGIDKPTDVLAFALDEAEGCTSESLGDVAISSASGGTRARRVPPIPARASCCPRCFAPSRLDHAKPAGGACDAKRARPRRNCARDSWVSCWAVTPTRSRGATVA